jgi:hypothetical protein
MENPVIVYGFNWECKIYYKDDAILCKSIETKLPVYAAPYIIEETEISNVIEKIKEIERTQPEIFDNINKLAKSRGVKNSWKLVMYDNLYIDVGYESEGDENGDHR